MFVRIESSSGVPITRQILDQVRAQVASGALAPGDRLPSVRVLAHELAVNQNTVLRVYERLETEGLIDRRHGDGCYVSRAPTRGQVRAQHELVEREVERLARQAASLGLGEDEIRAIVERTLTRLARERKRERED
jgi:GntR family transcriptional regulator